MLEIDCKDYDVYDMTVNKNSDKYKKGKDVHGTYKCTCRPRTTPTII